MGKIVYDVSMSLDGFIASTGITRDDGLGIGGEVLHDWYMAGERIDDRQISDYYNFGAFVVGRTTYDNSIKWWGADGHAEGPTIIVSRRVPEEVPGKGAYIFVTSVEAALDLARRSACGRNIRVMGGSIASQLLRAGVLDEIAVHIAPVLFGSGLPLFGEGSEQLHAHIALERIDCLATAGATHVFYRVVKA